MIGPIKLKDAFTFDKSCNCKCNCCFGCNCCNSSSEVRYFVINKQDAKYIPIKNMQEAENEDSYSIASEAIEKIAEEQLQQLLETHNAHKQHKMNILKSLIKNCEEFNTINTDLDEPYSNSQIHGSKTMIKKKSLPDDDFLEDIDLDVAPQEIFEQTKNQLVIKIKDAIKLDEIIPPNKKGALQETQAETLRGRFATVFNYVFIRAITLLNV